MQPADSQKSMIDNTTLLYNKLTALFIRWQRAQELYDFVLSIETKCTSLLQAGRLHMRQAHRDLAMQMHLPSSALYHNLAFLPQQSQVLGYLTLIACGPMRFEASS